MILNLKDKIFGKESEIKKRLEVIYGNADCDEIVRSLQSRNRKKYILLFIILLIVTAVLTIGIISSNQGVIHGKDGAVTALERPDDALAKHILSVKEFSSGKRLLVGTVVVMPEGSEKVKIEVTESETEEEYKQQQLSESKSRAVKRVLSDVTLSTQGSILTLPEVLPDGTKIIFEKKSNVGNVMMALVAGIVLCIYLYYKRYNEADRAIINAKQSVKNELPDFINKLVLLLEAGLIVTSAFDKILEKPKDNSYFYQQLMVIQSNIKQTNASFDREFGSFARRIGVRELMRTSNIIGDNLDKGAALSEKLMAEGNLLWHERKKAVEEAGKIAETKLTFPLMILLIVLIMITIAPAMMEM